MNNTSAPAFGTNAIYAYDDSDYFTPYNTPLFLSLSAKMIKKRFNYGLNDSYFALGVLFKNANYEKESSIYNFAPNALSRYFRKRYSASASIDIEIFKNALGGAIIENVLQGNNKILSDFEFDMAGGRFIFSTIENDNKTHTMFVWYAVNERANEILEKQFESCDRRIDLKFVNHVNIKKLAKYIKNDNDMRVLYSMVQNSSMFDNFMKEYNAGRYTNISCIDFDMVRLENNFVKVVLKIAEYLGHGSYQSGMSESDKKSINSYVFNGGENKSHKMCEPLRLNGKSVFFTGVGVGKNDEKLIVLSR
jgi:hypothetical protein